MKSKIGHIYLYVSDIEKSFSFYEKILNYLEYQQTVKEDWGFCFINNGTSFWFEKTPKDGIESKYNRRSTGLNHIAFRVNSKEEVDQFVKDILVPNNIKPLYDSPKPYPEYDQDYYAVYFSDPDGIKLEVTYYP